MLTRSSGVRAGHRDVRAGHRDEELEKMSWSQAGGGQRRRKMGVYPQQREGHPQRCKVRGDREHPENSKHPGLEYKQSSDI